MNQETKQVFSIRTYNTGTHSALLGKFGIALATTAILLSAGTVNALAEEGTTPQPSTEAVADAGAQPADLPADAVPMPEPVIEVPIDVAPPADVVAEQPKSEIPKSVDSTVTQDQAVKAVDDAQTTLKDNVDTAKDVGVVVKQGDTKTVVVNDGNVAGKTTEILTDLNKQDQAVIDATATQKANQKAYEDTKSDHTNIVSNGQKDLKDTTAEVDKLIEQAKKAGLLVDVTTTTNSPDYKDVKGLTGDELRKAMADNLALYQDAVNAGINLHGKSVQDLQAALALYKSNLDSYNKGKVDILDAKTDGVSKLTHADARQDQLIALAKKHGVTVTVKGDKVTPKYIDLKGLTGDKLTQAIKHNIDLYKKTVAAGVIKQDQSTKDAQDDLDNYIKAQANYKAGIGAKQSGIKWQAGTNVVAGTAQRMTGNEPAVSWGNLRTAAATAIQGVNRDQNVDANFDNIFKINGSGTVTIKGTSNGDVTLRIANIQAWMPSGGTYLAVWGAKDGGIAWGVFAINNNGTVTGGAGEDQTGGNIGATGNVLSMVKSYDYEVTTSKAISSVTVNDIDIKQTVTVNGLDGSEVNLGRNVVNTGNRYYSNTGDVSQSSSGKVGSNGIQFNFDTAKRQQFIGSHYLPGYDNTSLVMGIFGVSSEVATEPKKPKLEVTNVDVTVPEAPEAPEAPKVSVQKMVVEAPDAPEAPKPVEVEVNYYNMEKTPTPPAPPVETPVQPAAVLPNTGEASSLLSVIGGAMLSGLGVVGLRKRKK